MPDKITIAELEATTSALDTDYIAIDNGEYTKKITVANYNTNANATAKYYAEQAADSASAAAGSAETAGDKATEVTTQINAAAALVTEASTYASSAAGSAGTASTKASEASASATFAAQQANNARTYAANIDAAAKLSQSWAVGGTGTRTGEDQNNAKYWANSAQAIAGGGVTSWNGRGGIVAPLAGDYDATMIPIASASSTSTAAAIAAKQDTLTFDSTPTASSTNPCTSGGIKDYVDGEVTTLNTAISGKLDKPTKLTGSVASNGTVTFTNAAITGDALIEIYTSVPELNYTDIDDSVSGTLTITYGTEYEGVTVWLVISAI